MASETKSGTVLDRIIEARRAAICPSQKNSSGDGAAFRREAREACTRFRGRADARFPECDR